MIQYQSIRVRLKIDASWLETEVQRQATVLDRFSTRLKGALERDDDLEGKVIDELNCQEYFAFVHPADDGIEHSASGVWLSHVREATRQVVVAVWFADEDFEDILPDGDPEGTTMDDLNFVVFTWPDATADQLVEAQIHIPFQWSAPAYYDVLRLPELMFRDLIWVSGL